MAPIRRYLRITAYSVLEVRIYLDNPADTYRWLLRPRDPMLPRIIQAVRPLVLPKLREERERTKKGSKRKGVKDIVTEDDFEVSIFLTELSSPHSILTRQKRFLGKGKNTALGTQDAPMEVEDDGEVPILREEVDDDDVAFDNIPLAGEVSAVGDKRKRMEDDTVSTSDSSEEGREVTKAPSTEQQFTDQNEDANEADDKKKMGINTTYDGFHIYGRILCLVVKRKGSGKAKQPAASGQIMMEDWIASTQAAEGRAEE